MKLLTVYLRTDASAREAILVLDLFLLVGLL